MRTLEAEGETMRRQKTIARPLALTPTQGRHSTVSKTAHRAHPGRSIRKLVLGLALVLAVVMGTVGTSSSTAEATCHPLYGCEQTYHGWYLVDCGQLFGPALAGYTCVVWT